MVELCEIFGISRKTGHKWKARYETHGMVGLEDRSRAPKTVTSRTKEAVERLIVALRYFEWEIGGNRGQCAKSNYLTPASIRSSHAANSFGSPRRTLAASVVRNC